MIELTCTLTQMLQKPRVSSSRSRTSEVRSEPELAMYRSATMPPKDSGSKPIRQDFPKPKPPSLKSTSGPGRVTRSLEYNSEGGYKTTTVAARQSGQSKSSRTRTAQNTESLASDFQRNRRVRSNTCAFDHATGPKREVTLLELRNGAEVHGRGRTYRLNSESNVDDYRSEKIDRLR